MKLSRNAMMIADGEYGAGIYTRGAAMAVE